MKYVGAHVSAAGGVANAITNLVSIGADAGSLFLKARTWNTKELSQDHVDEFKAKCAEYHFDVSKLIPHGQYIVNLASNDAAARSRAYNYFKEDVGRCERLGIRLYNIHPGSTAGKCLKEDGIKYIAENINKCLDESRKVTIVLENMAGQGNVIGGQFDELASIIDQVEDKDRIGVCIDTCHMFAAGYDIRTRETFDRSWQIFDETIGLKYLKALHLNDSKTEFNSKKDRHQNLGSGFIGIDAFKYVMESDLFQNIPLILETPLGKNDDTSVWKREIELLRSFELE